MSSVRYPKRILPLVPPTRVKASSVRKTDTKKVYLGYRVKAYGFYVIAEPRGILDFERVVVMFTTSERPPLLSKPEALRLLADWLDSHEASRGAAVRYYRWVAA